MVGGGVRRLPPVLSTALGWTVAVVAVGLVVLATTAGFVERLLRPDDAPYSLVSREVGDHPLAVLAILVVVAVPYVLAFRWLCARTAAWRDGVTAPTPTGRWVRVAALVDHVFARWYRVAAVLAIVWLPFYLTSFPGQPSPDAANMFTEFLQRRSDFAGAPPLAPADLTAPYVDYPTSTYLMDAMPPGSDSMWSNHHPLFLMLGYGSICWVSIQLFGSLVPAIVLISAASALFTLVAFGRALTLLGRHVPSWWHRGLALALTLLSPLIALWSMAEHKNQLFCAAFVWWLALLARLVHSPEPVGRRWYAETVAVSLVMAVSVQFGWIVLVAQALALLVTRHRVAGLVAVGVPAVLVYASIALVTAGGAAVPSDPVETKGTQMQLLALTLREHPDALTERERADLSRIFDLDEMVAVFDPSSSDPLKSTGPLERKSGSFRYETVQPEDWDVLNPVVVRLAREYPATFVDGLFLKSYRYLDPFDEGTDWYPPWSPGYERTVDGHQVAPVELNATLRGTTRDVARSCYSSFPCRPTLSHGVRTVALVLLLAAAIAVRRRYAWLWALPFALQLGIAGVSPLSAGGRYVLAFTYALGVVVLLLATSDRSDETAPATHRRLSRRAPASADETS
ncbi:hypothetical protein FE634_19380 [Nocardioides dongxiaopingii]|uniref:DUF6020 family protein n=1 Tax=Nocardioides sp. S-1144 TaxID=2582905 RepID=UPI0011644D39|nr:DUF6020 family protein [Nocardioides sp. S-1144]QCW52030.2 hypothetical protein FE634_19380 [Nocardioides sp. S-1144]